MISKKQGKLQDGLDEVDLSHGKSTQHIVDLLDDSKKKKKGPIVVSDKSHPSYELVYDMLIGIKNAG